MIYECRPIKAIGLTGHRAILLSFIRMNGPRKWVIVIEKKCLIDMIYDSGHYQHGDGC